MKLLLAFGVLIVSLLPAFGQNEQSPIVEKDLVYKDWTLKGVRDFKVVTLQFLIKGNKLVAVVYFAPWCPNWRHDAPILEKLYEKFRGNGFEIVAVGEYGPTDDM